MRSERISMRGLAEFSLLHGDLFAEGANAARLRDGMLNHQQLQSLYTDGMIPEVALSIRVPLPDCELLVSGRADGLKLEDDHAIVEEIKSSPARVKEDTHPEHWAQAVGYAHMVCERDGLSAATVRLVYVHSLSENRMTVFTREYTREALTNEFNALIDPYMNYLRAQITFGISRDESIAAARFPFPDYRDGQARMVKQIRGAIKDGHNLLIQAPTGIGKTMASLYPAIKSLAAGRISKVMYLTARRTTRLAAENALALLRERGMRIRSCSVTAKSQICFVTGTRCVPEYCEYCRGYYTKRHAALKEAEELTVFNADSIRALAEKHRICPFELSLDVSEMADVIICDYNYAFDPRVYLRRYFTTSAPFALLIDEAHNLESRVRDMLSAKLEFARFVALFKAVDVQLGRDSRETQALIRLMTAWRTFCTDKSEPQWDNVPPKALIEACRAFTDTIQAGLPEGTECAAEWALCWFDVLNFARVGSEFDEERYYTLYEPVGANACDITLLCADPQTHLRKCLAKVTSAILFSATLSPLPYYFQALGLCSEDGDDTLDLPSPFLSENLLVRRVPVSTTYAQRDMTLSEIVKALHALAAGKVGNYIACFPSYAYMNTVASAFRRQYPDIRVQVQQSAMEERNRQRFLKAFVPEPKQSMLAFIVMGGIFSEGIDLPGSMLSGAAIIGVGMPQLCPEREALREHFDRKESAGFAFAYMYPGITKVLQAVGRVIRSEDDTGAALLLDERFFRPEYEELLPPFWHVGTSRVGELPRLLECFWSGESLPGGDDDWEPC